LPETGLSLAGRQSFQYPESNYAGRLNLKSEVSVQ